MPEPRVRAQTTCLGLLGEPGARRPTDGDPTRGSVRGAAGVGGGLLFGSGPKGRVSRSRGARGRGGGGLSPGAGSAHRGGNAAASMMQHGVRPRRRGGSLSVPGSLCCVNASWHTGSFVCRVWSSLCVLFEGNNRSPVSVMAVREGR